MSDKDIAISVNNVSKTFKLPHEQSSGLKQVILNVFRKNKKRGYETQHVLDGISFDIKKGEFFGIVGRNGSGKSTLLKLISQIYTPDKGSIEVNGSLTPFIELGVGFNPELTGRENVYLNGALLGFSNKQMDDMYDEIVGFAELERFMDQKLKNYSSGMQVRLAFSIAIRADTDILVLDEVLAVGDEAFQRKCYEYFASLKKHKKTVILVTHSMDSVVQFCDNAIMIEAGEIVESGNVSKVSQRYHELFIKEEDKGSKDEKGQIDNKNISAQVKHSSEDGRWLLDIDVKPKEPIHDGVLALILSGQDGTPVWNWASDYKGKELTGDILKNDLRLAISIQDIFPADIYNLSLYVRAKDRSKDYAIFESVTQFEKRAVAGSHQFDRGWQPDMKLEVIDNGRTE